MNFFGNKDTTQEIGLEYKLVFKENALKSIMDAKGWETWQDVATATGYTRSYICKLNTPDGEITHSFMIALALCLGSVEKNWWVHYRIVPKGEKIDPDHQIFNYAKYNGTVPYRPNSPSAEFRRKDWDVETRKNNL